MKNRINGFTLIEMLAVMFIIGIVFSIALPAFGPLTSTLKLSTASENLANTIESARQLAMTKGSEIYVVFPISADSNMDYRAYKIYDPDIGNPTPSPHTVGKWEILPVGVKIDSASTALGGDVRTNITNMPFPEDTDSIRNTGIKYLKCSINGSIVQGGTTGSNCSITLYYNINGNDRRDLTELFQEIVVYNVPQRVNIKDVGEV